MQLSAKELKKLKKSILVEEERKNKKDKENCCTQGKCCK